MFNLFLHLACFPVILPSNISHRRPSCLRKCPSQLCFWCQTVSNILLVSFTLCSLSVIGHLILPANLLHSSPNPHFKGLFLSANDKVQVSAAHKTILHMVLFITLFFNLHQVYLSIKTSYPWRPYSWQQSCLYISFAISIFRYPNS